MSFWLIMFPLLSALLGWLFTWLAIKFVFLPGFLNKLLGPSTHGGLIRQTKFSNTAAEIFNQQPGIFDQIEQKMLDPSHLHKIMPEIEQHIDHFLRVKLKDAMPMVAMFVGDKTITQMKEVFMVEMNELFPMIMKSYLTKLKTGINLEDLIAKKLVSVPPAKIESLLLKTFRKEFRYVVGAGALLGLILGTLQIIISLFASS